jgi:hypothetical protein
MKPEFKWLEWEDFPKIDCIIIEHGYISKYYKIISIWRDDNYRILFEMTGKLPDDIKIQTEFRNDKLKSGETINLEGIIKVKPSDLSPYLTIDIFGLLIN